MESALRPAGGLVFDADVMTAVVALNQLLLMFRGSEDFGEADAGVIAHLVEHPDGILCGEVSRGTGSEGAAA